MDDVVTRSSSTKWQRVGLIAGALAGLLLALLLRHTALVGFGTLAGILAGRAVDVRRRASMSAFYIALTMLVIAGAVCILIRHT